MSREEEDAAIQADDGDLVQVLAKVRCELVQRLRDNAKRRQSTGVKGKR